MKIQHLILTATTALMASNAYSATTYTYNADGRVIEENYGDDKYTYTYDGNGNQTSQTLYSCSHGSCTPSSKYDYTYEYTYDGNNITSQTMYSCSNGSCTTPNWKYEYTYDGNNQTSQTLYSCSNGSCTTPNWKQEYTYDGNNQTSATGYSCSNGSCTTPNWKYEYTYDGNNQTSRTSYSCSKGSCTTSSKYEYTYDGNNQTSETLYSCSNGSCSPNWKYEYAYSQTDDGGTEITFKWYDCAGDPCTLNETFVGQIKDKYGNLIYDWDNDYIYQYTYDKYGNMLSRKGMDCSDYDDNQSAAEFCMNMRATTDWEDVETESFVYDPEFIKKQWLQHRKLIYTLEEAQARVKEIGKDHVTFRIRYK